MKELWELFPLPFVLVNERLSERGIPMCQYKRKHWIIFFVFLLVMAILSGCSSTASADTSMDSVTSDSSYNQSTEAVSPGAGFQIKGENTAAQADSETVSDASEYTSEAPMEAVTEETSAPETSEEESDAFENGSTNFSEKIIYSANLRIETTQFDETIATVEALVKDFGGFIEASNTWGNTQYQSDGTTRIVDRNASYTLRIPAERFEEFLQKSGSIGNIVDSSRYAENITSQYTDQEARKLSLETQEDRLLDMLSKSTDVESLIQLESRLSEVRYEIESIERMLRNWQMQVEYSTICLDIDEVELYTPTASVQRTFGEKLSSALSDGWSGFVWETQSFVLGFVRNLPGILLFLAIVVVAFLVVRKVIRIRKARRHTLPEPPETGNSDNHPPKS